MVNQNVMKSSPLTTITVPHGKSSANGYIQCEFLKRKPDLISNLWKTKRKFIKLISGNDSSFIWHIGHAYWDDCSAINFVNYVKITLFPSFMQVARLSCVQGNPSLAPNFSKLEKDVTKLISVHDILISLL